MNNCPFCSFSNFRVITSNATAVAMFDSFPISPGHALVIPKRHIASLFEATEMELTDVFDLIAKTRTQLLRDLNPGGFNIGLNEGVLAGQTIMHLHIHLIPRYLGDKPDPRGGLRWIFPDKADYWTTKKE